MTIIKRDGTRERAVYKKKPISHKDWYGSETLGMSPKKPQEASDSPVEPNGEDQGAEK